MVFNKNWFLNNQTLLKWFANTSYGKGVLGHGLDKVDLILPNAVFQKEGKKIVGEFRTHEKYGKRLFYSYKPIWKAFHWFDENIAINHVPQLDLGFKTLTFYPDADPESTSVDGRAFRGTVNEVFATIRGGAGSSATSTTDEELVSMLLASSTNNQYAVLSRVFTLFDTSTIPNGSTIDSATYSIYMTASQDDLAQSLGVVESTVASNTNLVSGDYDGTVSNTTLLANALDVTSVSDGAYNNFTLNSNGLLAVTSVGITKLGIKCSSDYNNSAPTWASGHGCRITYRFADYAGTTSDPKLVVTFTPSGGNPMFFSGGGITVG